MLIDLPKFTLGKQCSAVAAAIIFLLVDVDVAMLGHRSESKGPSCYKWEKMTYLSHSSGEFFPCYSGQAFTQYAFQHEPGISVVEDLSDHPQKNSVRVGCFVHTDGYNLGLSSISETTPPLHPNQSECLQKNETDRHRERYLYSTACCNSLSTMRWEVITWSIDVSCTLCVHLPWCPAPLIMQKTIAKKPNWKV
jgi:hypothetical protein